MPLRLKLLLIAMVAAVFPLAGWRFIVQMETALRESQERALMASARTLATALPAADPTLRGSLVAPAAGTLLTYRFDAVSESTGISELLNRLAAQGIAFRDLRTSESTLEEIFVNLVRERA